MATGRITSIPTFQLLLTREETQALYALLTDRKAENQQIHLDEIVSTMQILKGYVWPDEKTGGLAP